MTEQDKHRIDSMTREQMARIWRFSPVGSWPFNERESGDYFTNRFKKLGGWSPELSKQIGWRT